MLLWRWLNPSAVIPLSRSTLQSRRIRILDRFKTDRHVEVLTVIVNELLSNREPYTDPRHWMCTTFANALLCLLIYIYCALDVWFCFLIAAVSVVFICEVLWGEDRCMACKKKKYGCKYSVRFLTCLLNPTCVPDDYYWALSGLKVLRHHVKDFLFQAGQVHCLFVCVFHGKFGGSPS